MDGRAEFLTLGAIEIRGGEDADAVAALRTQPKPLAVLAYLALARGGSVRRDEVQTIFWPERGQRRGRAALSQTLYVLRSALGADAVSGHGKEELSLGPGVWCDAAAFRRALQADDLEAAFRLYRGDLLPAFHLGGSVEFERWLEEARSALRDEAVRAATALAVERSEAGNAVEEIHWLRRAAEWAPYDEEVHRLLLRALASMGDRTGLRRHHETFRRRLGEDLDLEPASETETLFRTLVEKGGGSGAGADQGPDETTGERDAGVDPEAGAMARGPRGRGRRAAILLTAVAAAFLAWALGSRTGEPGGAAAAAGPLPVLLVADLEAPGPDSLLARAATAALRTALAQSEVVRPVPEDELAQALRRMERSPGGRLPAAAARELARREGLALVASGGLDRAADGILVSIRILDAEGGRALATASGPAGKGGAEALLRALDRLARSLRDQLGEAGGAISASPPLARVTTASLPALLSYTRAIEALREGRGSAAIAHLEDALGLDPSFAAAHQKLASLLWSGQMDRCRGLEALREAYRHRDRLTEEERFLVMGLVHFQIERNSERAAGVYEALVRRTGGAYGNNAAALLLQLGQPARAEEYARLDLRARPEVPWIGHGLVASLLAQGDVPGARAALDSLERRHPGRHQDTWGELAAALGEYEEAERVFAQAIEQGATVYGGRWAAYTAAARGRIAQARERLADILAHHARQGSGDAYLETALELAAIELVTGADTAGALATLQEAVDRYPPERLCPEFRYELERAWLLAAAGAPTRAEALLAEAGEWPRPADPARAPTRRPDLRHLARGQLLLSRGRAREAIAELRLVERQPSFLGCEGICHLPVLAEAYRAAGARDSAILSYERYLAVPYLHRGRADAVYRGRVHERLAALYEEAGEPRKAAAHWTVLRALWSGADPPLRSQADATGRRAEEFLAAEPEG